MTNLNNVFSASVSLLNSDLSLDIGATIEHGLNVEKSGVSPAFLGSTSMSQLLELSEKKKLIKEIYRVLKPNGKLIITTPNYQSAWILVEKIVNLLGEVKYQEQHITFFNKNPIHLLQMTITLIIITVNLVLNGIYLDRELSRTADVI